MSLNSPAYPRDMVGYGRDVPHVKWANNARVAVQFVLNYEEGGENCILHGDPSSEVFLSEIVAATAFTKQRHMSMESLYQYGSRVGVWRLLGLFREFDIPITIFAVGMALERHPELANYLKQENYDVCAHGLRWISYQDVDIDTERQHMKECIRILQQLLGKRPLGWYTGRTSPHTQQLVMEEGGFLYDSDAYDDDLPYWVYREGRPHLVVPYTLDVNDMRFLTPQGFNTGTQFYDYLKDSFDCLYLEGEHTPKMMSIGMHARVLGKPGRMMALRKFLDYVTKFERVWFCTRQQIADHWYANHFPKIK